MWSNRHNNDSFTREWLDRVVANNSWLDFYDESRVEVLTSGASTIFLSSSKPRTRSQGDLVGGGYSTLKQNGHLRRMVRRLFAKLGSNKSWLQIVGHRFTQN